MYKHYIKRLLDIFISFTAIVCLSPVFIIITIWLHFANKGAGAFFFQERPGKDAKIFKVIKYKTMTDERDSEGKLLPDSQRLTKVGRFVRSTSIDELPQFFNVLKGDMSLIGPRPLLVQYLPYYTEREKLRHTVRPGISGWAQVNGRNHVNWDKRLEYDVYYVENLSFKLDIKIFVKTILNVIRRKDIEVAPQGEYLDKLREREKDNNLYIRQLKDTDLQIRVNWMNNPLIYKHMSYSIPITFGNTHEWYNKIRVSGNRKDVVLSNSMGKIVAFGGLTNIDNLIKKAELYIFVNPDMHNMGIGTKATLILCNYGFTELGLNKIYLCTNKSNLGAKRIYEKVGFILEGTLRSEKIVDGKYEDRLYYGLLKSELL